MDWLLNQQTLQPPLQEHPNLNLRKIHYKLIRDKGVTEVRRYMLFALIK